MVAPAPKGAIQNCPLSEWPQEKVSLTQELVLQEVPYGIGDPLLLIRLLLLGLGLDESLTCQLLACLGPCLFCFGFLLLGLGIELGEPLCFGGLFRGPPLPLGPHQPPRRPNYASDECEHHHAGGDYLRPVPLHELP